MFLIRQIPFSLVLSVGLIAVSLRTTATTNDNWRVSAQVIDIIPRPPYAYLTLDAPSGGLHPVGSLLEVQSLRHGDLIDATIFQRPDNCLGFRAIRKTGHGPLPNPPTVTLPELHGRYCRPTAIRGIVQTVDEDETNPEWNWLTLQTPDGKLAVAAWRRDFPLSDLMKLSDAEVLLKGYPRPMTTWRSGLGLNFIIIKDYGLEILVPPPSSPSEIPRWTGQVIPHRQCVRGIVAAIERQRMFVTCPDGKIAEIRPQGPLSDIGCGDLVDAAGFVEIQPSGPLFTASLVSLVRKGTPSETNLPLTTLDMLFPTKPGLETLNCDFLRHLTRIKGTVIGRAMRPDGRHVFLLSDGRHTVEIDFACLPAGSRSGIDIGCVVDVTGLCLADVELDRTTPAHLHFRTFSILPRIPEDVRILSRPSWWTPARLLVVIGILLLVLAAILIWNRTLKILSERRGRALFKEQIAHATAELRTSERTRLAVEIHDSLSQNLSGVALQISAAKIKQGPDPAAAARHLKTAERMLRSSRTELRRCLWDLREEMLDEQVFADAIAKSVDPVSADATVDIRFNVPRQRLTDMSAHAILCIIRELVSNAVTHGNATHVRIAGESHDDELSFSVTDNGSGFDTDDHPGVETGHFGLDGIRERVRRLHGTLTLESKAGKGTRAVVRIRIIHPSQDTDAIP